MGAAVLLLAFLFDAPVLWRACVDQTVPLDTAVIRFLIAVPIVWVLLSCVRVAARRGDRDS